jgi:hypothetical protein
MTTVRCSAFLSVFAYRRKLGHNYGFDCHHGYAIGDQHGGDVVSIVLCSVLFSHSRLYVVPQIYQPLLGVPKASRPEDNGGRHGNNPYGIVRPDHAKYSVCILSRLRSLQACPLLPRSMGRALSSEIVRAC